MYREKGSVESLRQISYSYVKFYIYLSWSYALNMIFGEGLPLVLQSQCRPTTWVDTGGGGGHYQGDL